MDLLIYFFIAVITLVLTYLIQNHVRNRRFWELYGKFNGSGALPILGNTLEFGTDSEGVLNGLTRMWERHDKSTFRFLVGTTPFLGCCDPEVIEAILGSNKEIKKMTDYDFFKDWLGDGLLLSTGQKWRRHRKIITPTFHFKILEQFLDVFSENGNILIEKLGNHLEEPFDIYNAVTLCTLDVICETAMGTKVDAQKNAESDYVKAVYKISQILHERTFSFWKRYDFPYKFSNDYVEEKGLLKILHGLTDSVIQSRKNDLKSIPKTETNKEEYGIKNRTAFLDMLLQTQVLEGDAFSDEDIRAEVNTFMFEGHDTTSSCVSFAIHALANTPEVQKLAFAEQLSIFGNDLTKESTYADLQNMNYLERVIKETLRLYPSVPLYGRQNMEDLPLPDGRIIPAGTFISIITFLMGKNPKYFPDPMKFDPDRFLPENVRDKNPFMYVPFSAGPRNCIGQKFAMLEIKSIVSKILRNYELFPAGSKYGLKLVAEVIYKSKNGIHVILKRRF